MSFPDQLADKLFGGDMWTLTKHVSTIVESNSFAKLKLIALGLGFLVFIIEFFNIYVADTTNSKNEEKYKKLVNLFLMLIIIVTTIFSPVYTILVKAAIALPSQITSQSITKYYIEEYQVNLSEMINANKNSSKTSNSILNKSLFKSMAQCIIATIIFICARLLCFIIPVLQGILFKWLVMIGPICLIFSINSLTKIVAVNWLSLTLATAWTSFFASASLLLITNHGTMERLVNSSGVNDILLLSVHGIVAILMLAVGTFPIAIYMFSAKL